MPLQFLGDDEWRADSLARGHQGPAVIDLNLTTNDAASTPRAPVAVFTQLEQQRVAGAVEPLQCIIRIVAFGGFLVGVTLDLRIQRSQLTLDLGLPFRVLLVTALVVLYCLRPLSQRCDHRDGGGNDHRNTADGGADDRCFDSRVHAFEYPGSESITSRLSVRCSTPGSGRSRRGSGCCTSAP